MAMQEALANLEQEPRVFADDVIDLLATPKTIRKVVPKNAWAVINTTASLAVREALLAAASQLPAPVIEAGLYGAGAAATLAIEGGQRNPNIGDLIGVLYERAREDAALKTAVFPDGPTYSGIVVGQGCRSSTMILPDAQVSQFTSSMALVIADMRRGEWPIEGGCLWIGMRDGIQVTWQQHEVEPCELVPADGSHWCIRITANVHRAIRADIDRHPCVETGGVLMGRISEAARSFYVTGTIPAPEDSVRSTTKFVLGKKRLTAAIRDYSDSAGGGLYCLGTWHNHLVTCGPSALDRDTASIIGQGRVAPSVLLIQTPAGYRAFVTEMHRQ